MKTNIRKDFTPRTKNHEGASVKVIPVFEELKRTVSCCLLWENNFYENGAAVAERIQKLVSVCDPKQVCELALHVRSKLNIRHAPLYMMVCLVARPEARPFVKEYLPQIIQRADEISEFIALYWNGKKKPIANCIKVGLSAAFKKFNAYQFAKYKGGSGLTLRDVMFLCHPKPDNAEQAALWKKLANNELETPDTWEAELSQGKGVNKKESWERLIKENKLGGLAFIRNLKNFHKEGVNNSLIRSGLSTLNTGRVLPYRFIAAAKFSPKNEDALEQLMLKSIADMPKIKGNTVLMIDVSGSMNSPISSKSDLLRRDAANGLAILCREQCETVSVYTFANNEKEVPNRRGFALRDAIDKQFGGGTYLKKSVENVLKKEQKVDQLIIITDEQSQDGMAHTNCKTFIINVAPYQNGVDRNKNVTKISGFSEAVLTFICQELDEK